jgi:hypothetical protein
MCADGNTTPTDSCWNPLSPNLGDIIPDLDLPEPIEIPRFTPVFGAFRPPACLKTAL